MNNNRCILFAGQASQILAKYVTNPAFDIHLGSIYHKQFASGEFYCQIKDNVRGADVFLLQSLCGPVNDNLMQLLIMADAARRASAGRLTAVIPYFGYARQDRKDKPRVPISAKVVMNMLVAAGFHRIITMDLHAQQIQGFTDLPVDHLYFQPSLAEAMTKKDIQVIVSPDIGAVKKATEYASKQNKDIAFIVKNRKNDTDVEVSHFVGDVKEKNILILDDLTESAGTLIAAAEECKNNKAAKVYAAVTHACVSEIGKARLQDSYDRGIIDGFFCSDTVTEDWDGGTYGTIVSVGEIFGKAIHGIHNNTSITSLFN
jgi:ribose-phosphate pyrophosphokinase